MKRTKLYHSVYGEYVFTDDKEFLEAVDEGWVDAPWEVNNPTYKVDLKQYNLDYPKKKPGRKPKKVE